MECRLVIIALCIVLAGCGKEGYTALYLNNEPGWISFSVENRNGFDRNYAYQVFGGSENRSLLYIGVVKVAEGKTATVYTPRPDNVTRFMIVLDSGESLSFYTNYSVSVPVVVENKVWRPEIVQGLSWDDQDPLVQHFYRYETGSPKQDNKK